MTTDRVRPARLFSRLCSVGLTLACAAVARADVDLSGSISLGAAETDNLTLVNDNQERQLVYQLFPEFEFSQESVRTATQLSYRLESYHYDGRGEDDVYQLYDGSFQVELDPDNFFLEIGAVRDQTLRSPDDVIARSNLPLVSNRVDRDNYYAGPRLRYFVGSEVTVESSYRTDLISYEEDDPNAFFVNEYEVDTFDFAIDNYRGEAGFTWAFRAESEKTDYRLGIPWEFRRAGVEAGGWFGSGFRLFASVGQESAWDNPFDPTLAENFWEVGFARNVSSDFSAELAFGERGFGNSARGYLSWRFPRGGLELIYAEEPTAIGLDPFQNFAVSTVAAAEQDLEDILARPGSAEHYLSNLLQANFNIELDRVVITLSVLDERRMDRVRLDGTLLEDESQFGVYLNGTWQIGARTSLFLRVENLTREFAENRDDRLHLRSVGAEYDFGRRTSAMLEFTRTEEISDYASADINYTADLVSLMFTRTFE